jgi:hypothetical protein
MSSPTCALRLGLNLRKVQFSHYVRMQTIKYFFNVFIYSSGGRPSRAMYAVLYDIHNIRSEFKLRRQPIHQDDFQSLRFEADRQMSFSKQDQTLLFLKNLNEKSREFPKLTESHFIAVIQTDFQREMLQRHGGKRLCIDATHGVARFTTVKLVSIVVLDDCERGIPVAHCLINHEDMITIETFFRVLLDQLQFLNVIWFLSDGAEAFFNAWTEVVGGTTKKLLCIWHVLKNVNQKVYCRIHNAEFARRILFLFRSVMYAHTMEVCDHSLVSLRNELSEFQSVSDYLETYYLNRIPQWALIYRVGSRMSTSGHIESFHRSGNRRNSAFFHRFSLSNISL